MPKSFEPWLKIPRDVLKLSHENELVVPVFVYLCIYKNMNNLVFGTAYKMAHSCGLVPDGRSGRSFDQCSSALELLRCEGYLTDYSEPGYVCRKHEHYFELADAKFDVENNFAMIEFGEVDKLLAHRNSPNKKMDCSSSYEKLLRVLFYIRLHRNTVHDGEDDLVYSLLRTEQIACDLRIAHVTALNAIRVLRNLCIIDYSTYKVQGRDLQWRTVANIFISNVALDNKDLFGKIKDHLKRNSSYR